MNNALFNNPNASAVVHGRDGAYGGNEMLKIFLLYPALLIAFLSLVILPVGSVWGGLHNTPVVYDFVVLAHYAGLCLALILVILYLAFVMPPKEEL